MGGKLGPSKERFERFYMPEPNSGCWLWLGAIDAKGYGQFYYPPQNMVRAHIVAWELFRGSRKGLHVLHNCDRPYCVNPGHLRLGTHQDNMADRDSRGRQYDRHGVKNGRTHLTEADVRKIRMDDRWQRFIAKDYRITVSTVKAIQNRLTWKHIP